MDVFAGSPRVVTGGMGTRLAVWEAGATAGRALVFIHGLGFPSPVWRKQLSSDLLEDFRMVALDLRGHGCSARPRHGYDRGEVWAEDLRAVIEECDLAGAVLVPWSYGGLVVLDYLRQHGDRDIGGIVFAGASHRGGSAAWRRDLGIGEDFDAVRTVPRSVEDMVALVGQMTARPLPYDERCLWLGMGMGTPRRVRAAMLRRAVDNDDVLRSLTRPALVLHGRADAAVPWSEGRRAAQLIPDAELQVFDDVGHAPFWEIPQSFNHVLRGFASSGRSGGE